MFTSMGQTGKKLEKRKRGQLHLIDLQGANCWIIEGEDPIKYGMLQIYLYNMIC